MSSSSSESDSDTLAPPSPVTAPDNAKKRKADASEDEEDAPAPKAARASQHDLAGYVPDFLKALHAIGPNNIGHFKSFGDANNGVKSFGVGTLDLKRAAGVVPIHFKVPPGFIHDVHLRGLGQRSKDGSLAAGKYTYKVTWSVGFVTDEMAAANPTLRADTRAWIEWAKRESRDTLFRYCFDRERATDDAIKAKIAKHAKTAARMKDFDAGQTAESYADTEAFLEWLGEGMEGKDRWIGYCRGGEGDSETMTVSFECNSSWAKGDKDPKPEPRRDVGNAELQELLDVVGPWGFKSRGNTPRFFGPSGNFLVDPVTGRTFNDLYEMSEKNCPPADEPLKDGDFVAIELGLRGSSSAKGKSVKVVPVNNFVLLKRMPSMAPKLAYNAPPVSGYSFEDPFASSSSSSAAAAPAYMEEGLGDFGFE